MAFVEKLMSLNELIDSINRMPAHNDVEFFYQNIELILREMEIEFKEIHSEAIEENTDDEGWVELDD